MRDLSPLLLTRPVVLFLTAIMQSVIFIVLVMIAKPSNDFRVITMKQNLFQ